MDIDNLENHNRPTQYSLTETVANAYLNDGFLYCVTTMDNRLRKLGKTQMLQSQDKDKVLSSILNRYSTYYPNCSVVHVIRVGNYHEAEKMLFEVLQDIHYEREFFWGDPHKIREAFAYVSYRFPHVGDLLPLMSPEEKTDLNRTMRALDIAKTKSSKTTLRDSDFVGV